MTLYEYYDRKVPEYYPSMHLDGYAPAQILQSTRRKLQKAHEAREAEAEPMEIPEVRIRSEVKIK